MKVRSRRSELGIEQTDLADIAGVAVHTISNIEMGTANPTISTLNKVLDVLGLEIRAGVKE